MQGENGECGVLGRFDLISSVVLVGFYMSELGGDGFWDVLGLPTLGLGLGLALGSVFVLFLFFLFSLSSVFVSFLDVV